MPGIALVTNPRSGTHRRTPDLARRLAERVGTEAWVLAPADLPELADAARRLRDRDVDLILVSGGDGTLHRALGAFLPAWGDDPLPPIAPLPSGTMNIVARSVGLRGRPEAVLDAVLREHGSGRPPRTTTRSALRIEGDGFGPAWGFLFGNGVVARFLERYYAGPTTPARAAALLARGAASAVHGGPFARALTTPWEGTLALDGVPWGGRERWTAVAVGTVEQMGLGTRPFHASAPGRLHLVAIGGSVADLARDLPRIVRGLGPARPGNLEAVGRSVRLSSRGGHAFTIDGDLYHGGAELTVTVDRTIRFVVPGAP